MYFYIMSAHSAFQGMILPAPYQVPVPNLHVPHLGGKCYVMTI